MDDEPQRKFIEQNHDNRGKPLKSFHDEVGSLRAGLAIDLHFERGIDEGVDGRVQPVDEREAAESEHKGEEKGFLMGE